MSSAAEKHGQDHSALVCLYALEALPPSEVPALKAHISACAQCQDELEGLGPVIESFASWPTDLLRPSTSLRKRLAQSIAADKSEEAELIPPARWAEPEWEDVAPGISCKLLATDSQSHRVSMLVRLAPGAEYPPHSHSGVEELHLLHGELMIDNKKLYPGDYNRGEPGAVDSRVWSETGCTCVLITSTRDELR